MARRCSHCSNNGHNSRTCPGRSGCGGVKLFGVRLTEGVGAMKKSASMGNLSSSISHHGSSSSDLVRDHAAAASGYASDDTGHASCSSNCRNERKKGTPWTEEEHRMFLLGLQKLGKGDWRGIARNFVVSRTPTQVASHAQKYFIRQTNATRRKRRSSLFDMVPELPIDHLPLEDQPLLHSPPNEFETANKLLPCLGPDYVQEPQLADFSSSQPSPPEAKEDIPVNNITLPLVSTYYPALVPVTLSFWPPNLATHVIEEEMMESHEVLKPIPVLRKDLANADELVSMSKLSIGEGVSSRIEPSALSVKLLETSATRQSAFHMNPSISRPGLSQNGSNVIHAI